MAQLGPRRAALVAGLAGARAFRAGQDPTACPVSYERPLVRRAWFTGYAAARRKDTGKDLADLELEQDPGAPAPDEAPDVR